MRHIYYILIFLLVLVTYKNVCAEDSINSLEKKINLVAGEQKVNLFNQLSRLYSDNNPDKSFEYAKQALELSIKIKYSDGAVESYFNAGL
ncbi:MAG: hypothetical protein WCT77_00755, partial [Bacteroidota bacterium]